MHRLLTRFEHAAREGILLIYLSALFLASAVYFTSHGLKVGPDLLFYVGAAEAFAVEVHSFLSQRMTRSLHIELAALSQDAPYPVRDALEARYRLHLRITIGLVAFSCFNSIAFWATIMRPQNLGDWLQVFLRGVVIPVAFLAAGFLTSVREDVGETLNAAADELTRTMVNASTRQWKQRVRKAKKRGADLAEAVAQLIEMQEGGAQPVSARIRLMNTAIRTAESGGQVGSVAPSPERTEASSPRAPRRPPTGPGAPVGATPSPVLENDTLAQAGSGSATLLTMPRKRTTRTTRPAAMKVRAKLAGEALETARRERIAEILAQTPDATPNAIAKALHCGHKTATRLIDEYRREQARQAQ